MGSPRLVIGDGHLGISGALWNVFPEADKQRCWHHKILNVMNRLFFGGPQRRLAQLEDSVRRTLDRIKAAAEIL